MALMPSRNPADADFTKLDPGTFVVSLNDASLRHGIVLESQWPDYKVLWSGQAQAMWCYYRTIAFVLGMTNYPRAN